MQPDQEKQIDSTDSSKPGQAVKMLLMLAWLVILEWLVFGKSMRAGFYLDDWTMLHSLHFAPRGLPEMIQYYLLHDPRVTMRPLEAVHFSLLYSLFAENPLGYHLAYAAFEILALWLFFIALVRIFKSKSLAFLATTCALLDPRHDTTHYWVMCNSVSLSLFLTLLSILLSDYGAARQKFWIHVSALVCFCLSIFNYEVFLPFLIINAVVCARHAPKERRIKSLLQWIAIFAAPVATLLLYQKLVVPLLVTPFVHGIILDPVEIISAIFDGTLIQTIPGCYPLAEKYLPLNWPEIKRLFFWLILPALAATFVFLKANESESKSSQESCPHPLMLSAWGLIIIVIGYSIFGLNKEYHPAVETIFNRVNTGSGLGAAMLFSGLMGAILQKAPEHRAVSRALVAILTVLLLTTYMSLDAIFQKPWLAATQVQKHIKDIVGKNSRALKPGDSILLANCPRYVNWTPVFDGVWDFERMLQITVGTNNIAGGVVSERLKVTPTQMQDISMGYLCESYKFPAVYVLIPDKEELIATPSAKAFIELINTRGRGFGLQEKTIKEWQEAIAKD